MSQQADGTQSPWYNETENNYNYPSQGEKLNAETEFRNLINDIDAIKKRLGMTPTDSLVGPAWLGFNTVADRLDSISGSSGGLPIATTPEAESGIVNDKTMTPLRSKEAIDFQRPFSSLIESEAGLDNSKINTPLRTFEAINYKERNFGELLAKDLKFISGMDISLLSLGTFLNIGEGVAMVGDLINANDRNLIHMTQTGIDISVALDTGSLSANTVYYIHLVTASSTDRQNPVPFAPYYIASLSNNTAGLNLQVNYDYSRVIGIIRTNSINQIENFKNKTSGNLVKTTFRTDFNSRAVLSGGSSQVITLIDLSMYLPPNCLASLFVEQRTNDDLEIHSSDGINSYIALLLDAGAAHRQSVIYDFDIRNPSISYQNLGPGANVNINVMGYTYER